MPNKSAPTISVAANRNPAFQQSWPRRSLKEWNEELGVKADRILRCFQTERDWNLSNSSEYREAALGNVCTLQLYLHTFDGLIEQDKDLEQRPTCVSDIEHLTEWKAQYESDQARIDLFVKVIHFCTYRLHQGIDPFAERRDLLADVRLARRANATGLDESVVVRSGQENNDKPSSSRDIDTLTKKIADIENNIAELSKDRRLSQRDLAGLAKDVASLRKERAMKQIVEERKLQATLMKRMADLTADLTKKEKQLASLTNNSPRETSLEEPLVPSVATRITETSGEQSLQSSASQDETTVTPETRHLDAHQDELMDHGNGITHNDMILPSDSSAVAVSASSLLELSSRECPSSDTNAARGVQVGTSADKIAVQPAPEPNTPPREKKKERTPKKKNSKSIRRQAASRLREKWSAKRSIQRDQEWIEQNIIVCGLCTRFVSNTQQVSMASYCSHCNCHVCFSCDCSSFHLDQQDTYWESVEHTNTTGSVNIKKRKRRKTKKTKMGCSTSPDAENTEGTARVVANKGPLLVREVGSVSIDLLGVLSQTGSIIALANFIDEQESNGIDLDYGYNATTDFHAETPLSVA
jgi:hypothetical protein